MSAMGTAITGMQGSQKWLDVISNNVTNSQTVAYKAGRLSFADIISQGLRNPSGPRAASNLGGINPSQVGLGVTVGTIQVLMEQGSLQITGHNTDVAISGVGFLTVAKGADTLYTRAGNLTFDQTGNLVTADGGKVQGWSQVVTHAAGAPFVITGPTLTTAGAPKDIVIPNNLIQQPKATGNNAAPAIKDLGVLLKGNLDNRTPQNADIVAGGTGDYVALGAAPSAYVPDATTTFTVYDSLGTPYTILASFTQTVANTGGLLAPVWTVQFNDITDGSLPNSTAWAAGPPGTHGNRIQPVGGALTNITFNPDGSLLTDATGGAGNIILTMPLTNGAVVPFDFSVNIGTDAVNDPALVGLRDGLTGDDGGGFLDTTGVYYPVQSVYTAFSDGYAEGHLTGLSFNQGGGVDASFSNGHTFEIAKLALTQFSNVDGLSRVGGNYFARNQNSGQGQVGEAGKAGFGTIVGGALEASNVDLTVELTNMILAQRMFESNSRVVTASDRVLDALVNLGR